MIRRDCKKKVERVHF